MKRYGNVLISFLMILICMNGVAGADSIDSEQILNPSGLSAKITETMRELQARYHYFRQTFQDQDAYICWSELSGFNIVDCSGTGYINTPNFPPDNWYVQDIKEASDPADRVKTLVDSLFNAWKYYSYYSSYVKKSCWDLEGSDRVLYNCAYPYVADGVYVPCNCISYHNFDFPELYEFADAGTCGEWYAKIVTKYNYTEILDALNEITKKKLNVYACEANTSDRQYREVGSRVLESDWHDYRNYQWPWTYGCSICYSQTRDMLGECERTKRTTLGCIYHYPPDPPAEDWITHAGRFKISCDATTRFNGNASIYLKIKSYPEGFSNLNGLKACDDKWQKVDSAQCGGTEGYLSSDYFANYLPSLTLGYVDDQAQTKGWYPSACAALIFPEFDVQMDPGITVDGSKDENIFKENEKYTVYGASSKVSCNEDDGECVDGVISCPWDAADILSENAKLFARVTLVQGYAAKAARLYIGGWDGSGYLLNKTDQTICVSKGPCSGSGCGLYLAEDYDGDGTVDEYRLKFSIVGGKTERETVSFKVQFWKQTGYCSDLDTYKAEKTITFTVKENHYGCCAKEDCGDSCPLPKPWKKPELKKMQNGDVQVFFPEAGDKGETYIFEEPRPGFIHNVSLEKYHGTATLEIKNSDGSVKYTLDNAVVLRYGGDIGLVYTVPASWWTEIDENAEFYPSGEGTFKCVVDRNNIELELSTESTNVVGNPDTRISNSGNPDIYTEYQRNDPSYPDRVTDIIHYDGSDPSYPVSRSYTVSYDAEGHVTAIEGAGGGGGCASCSSGGTDRVVLYDDDGNVIASFDKDGNPLYSFAYDQDGELITTALGSFEEPVQEIIRTSYDTYTRVDTVNYSDSDNYTLSRQIQDKTGRIWEQISYEDGNVEPAAPFGKYYRTLYRYAPVHMSDPDLQAYWTFDDGSGGWALDSSQFDRTGLLSGYTTYQVPWTTGLNGSGCITFDGNDDYMAIQGYKGVVGKQSRTICFWTKTSSSATGPIISWGNSAGQDWAVSILGGKPTVDVSGSASGTCTANTAVPNNTWCHVAIVLNNDGSPNVNEIKIYRNAVDDTESGPDDAAVNTTVGPDVRIGENSGIYYSGQLDNLMILDRALSAREIEVLYTTQKSSPVDIEVHISIPPTGDPSGNGIRTESVTTYMTGTNGRYISEQKQIQYGSNTNPLDNVEVSKTVYEAINGGENTRIAESWSYGAEMTGYEYADLTSAQVQDEVQHEVTQVAKQGQSAVTLQLARHYVYDGQGRVVHEFQYDRQTYSNFTPSYTGAGDTYNGTPYLAGSHYIYDGLGNLQTQYSTDGAYPNNPVQVTDYKYNGFKELYMTKSATGMVTGKIYDNAGRTQSEFTFVDPSVWSSIASYGQLLSECENSTVENRPVIGSLSYYTYGSTGRLERVQKAKVDGTLYYSTPDESAITGVTWVKTSYTYDAYGRRETVTQDAGSSRVTPLTTTFVYDNQGRAYMTKLPNGKYTKTVQDGRGQVKEQVIGYMSETKTEVPISVTQFKYDANGNLKEQIYPDGSRIQNEYDGYGRLRRVYKGVVPKN